MGYADMLGLFKGVGKGRGPGVAPEDQEGGMPGAARTGAGMLKSAGAQLMSNSPKLSQQMYMGDRAAGGAYQDMLRTEGQKEHDLIDTQGVSSGMGDADSIGAHLQRGKFDMGGQQQQDDNAKGTQEIQALFGGVDAIGQLLRDGTKKKLGGN